MGTKIQCKTYLPGFCSMTDLNTNGTNIPWLVNHESKSRKRNQCTDSVLPPQPVDGYFECDREKVRQTILKHETVFRHQLQELHRLYRRQRDLMNELQRKEMLDHPMRTFQSIPSLDSIAGQLSTTDTSKNQSSFDFMENDSRSSHFSSPLTKSSKECESHQPSSSLFQRKMFDARFVVNGSVNNERGIPCIQGNPVKGIYQMPQIRDTKTPFASTLEFHSDADLDRVISLRRTDELADLNKPSPLEEASPLVPDINISSINCLGDDIYDGGKFSPKSLKKRIGGICLNQPPHRNGEEQLTSKLNVEKKQLDNESSGRLETAEILPTAFQPPLGHQLFRHSLFKETKTEHQRKKTIFGVEIHEENKMLPASCSNVQTSTYKSPPVSQSYTELLRNVESCQSNMHMRIDRETSCVSRTEAAGKAPVSGDCQRKQENSRETLPWLVVKSQKSEEQIKGRENCYHLNLDSLQNNSQQFFRREDTVVNSAQIVDQRQGTISSRSIFEVSDSTKIRTIFGVPIFSSPTNSHAASGLSNAAFPNVDNVTATKISGDEIVSRSKVEAKDFLQEKGLNGGISSLRHQIDLNLSLDEEGAPSAPSLPRAVLRIATTEIGLEAAAILESEAQCGASKHTLEESNKSNEEAMRLAADSIISISMSGANGEMNDALQTESTDCLRWFAELVSNHCCVQQESIAREVCSGRTFEFDEDSIPDGFDYFEFMTLKLEDMKEEDYSYKMLRLESHNDEETAAITLPKRPRRGQARRGRQRKDFQRDVLPGLISLSRYEVNKDILKFEELFKASGSSWQPTMSLKKTGKSGRGRKRLSNADPSPTIPADCTPPVNQPCSGEVRLEEKSLTGWGKRTRRLPRQRYLNGNLALPLKQC